MVAMDGNPSLLQMIAWKVGKAATARRDRVATQPANWLRATVRLILHLAGFGCLTIAGFMWTMAIGMIVAGLSCFALSWLATSRGFNPPTPR
jgi:hypothetical protein